MIAKPLLACSTLVLALAGCNAQAPSPASASPPATEAPTSCGSEQFAGIVGQPATEQRIAEIQARLGDKPMRVIKPGMAVTMDYRPDRLNVEVDANGLITSLRCS